MNGRRYYFTTLGAWRRHAERCAETHFVVVGTRSNPVSDGTVRISLGESRGIAGTKADQELSSSLNAENVNATNDAARVVALVNADEGAHLAMENDAEFEVLPHPLARTPVSEHVADALTPFGVTRGDDTFTVAEKLAQVNPLLRHRVF